MSLDPFYAYLDYETRTKQHDTTRVKALYERAVSMYCTDVGVWDSYLSYMVRRSHNMNVADGTF